MGVYAEVAKRSFRRHSTYRAATAAGAFTNTVFGFIQAYVMVAVFETRDDVNGLDLSDALTWVFLSQSLIACLGVFHGVGELGQRVKTGEIVVDLYRPVDFQGYWLAADMGQAVFNLFARGAVPLLAGSLVFDLRLPSPGMAAAFAASIAIAMVVSFAWRFIVSLSTFWIVDANGPTMASILIMGLLSGFMLPLQFFPDWARAACRALPFSAMVQLPLEVFLGKHSGADVAGVLAYQLFWAAVLLAAGRALLPHANRQVEALGG